MKIFQPEIVWKEVFSDGNGCQSRGVGIWTCTSSLLGGTRVQSRVKALAGVWALVPVGTEVGPPEDMKAGCTS